MFKAQDVKCNLSEPIMTKGQYDYVVGQLRKKSKVLIMKRAFDIVVSFSMIVLILPVLSFCSLLILTSSGYPVFFRQERMGRNGKVFRIFKFRTMKNNTATADGLTLRNDQRITKIGQFLRKYRLDEVPQLFNIIKGEMSFVGPRPDLPKYYKDNDYAYKCVTLIRPGVTCPATLQYKDEDEILALSEDPEKTYIEEVFPNKVRLNLDYIIEISILYDLKIMIDTCLRVFFKTNKLDVTLSD